MYLFFHPFGQIRHVGYTPSTLLYHVPPQLPLVFPFRNNCSYTNPLCRYVTSSSIHFSKFVIYLFLFDYGPPQLPVVLLLYDHSLFCGTYSSIAFSQTCQVGYITSEWWFSTAAFLFLLVYSYVWFVVDIFFLVRPKCLSSFSLIFIKISFVLPTLIRISQLVTSSVYDILKTSFPLRPILSSL